MADHASMFTDDLEWSREHGDLPSQRRYVWEVITTITRVPAGSDRPLFETWHGESDVFTDVAKHSSRGIRGFLRVKFHGGTIAGGRDAAPTSLDVPTLTYTLYNEEAYNHIRDARLNHIPELERLRIHGQMDRSIDSDRSIPPFPAQAKVLKTVWWPVAQDAMTALPVWDPAENQTRHSGNSYTTWQRVVAIDPLKRTAIVPRADIDFAGREFRNVRRVGIDAFYHVVVDEDMEARMMADEEARKTSFIALGRALHVGDYLVLVAANLATKELVEWTWAAFWWHDRAELGPFAADRPDALTLFWRNYLMQVAFDSETPAELNAEPHICFNPWLEGRFPDGGHGGGTASNCLACHRRASYPPVSFLPITRGAPDRGNDPAYSPGRLRTGFLWSIALHAQP